MSEIIEHHKLSTLRGAWNIHILELSSLSLCWCVLVPYVVSSTLFASSGEHLYKHKECNVIHLNLIGRKTNMKGIKHKISSMKIDSMVTNFFYNFMEVVFFCYFFGQTSLWKDFKFHFFGWYQLNKWIIVTGVYGRLLM